MHCITPTHLYVKDEGSVPVKISRLKIIVVCTVICIGIGMCITRAWRTEK
jgi:hypothetical protein